MTSPIKTPYRHYGVLGTVNGVAKFASSATVGGLWMAVSPGGGLCLGRTVHAGRYVGLASHAVIHSMLLSLHVIAGSRRLNRFPVHAGKS